ncbi:hypothetical protein LguiB_028243 [Lonicera macranthoides]
MYWNDPFSLSHLRFFINLSSHLICKQVTCALPVLNVAYYSSASSSENSDMVVVVELKEGNFRGLTFTGDERSFAYYFLMNASSSFLFSCSCLCYRRLSMWEHLAKICSNFYLDFSYNPKAFILFSSWRCSS